MPRAARSTRNRPPFRGRSVALGKRLHAIVPGGAHTHAKGDDRNPEEMAPVLVAGRGCRVRDVDGNLVHGRPTMRVMKLSRHSA